MTKITKNLSFHVNILRYVLFFSKIFTIPFENILTGTMPCEF